MERAGARSEIEGFLVTQNIAEEATQCPLSLSPSLSPSLPLNALPLSLPPSLPLSLGHNIFANDYFYPQGKSSAVILKFELFHTPTPEMRLVNDALSPLLFIK